MKEHKQSPLAVLLGYAGRYKGLTFLGLGLSAAAMILGMLPYICIWLVARRLITVAPDWTQASSVAHYGWMAFAFSVGGIVVYFFALICTHLAAFRTASNIRKAGMTHLMKAPLGFFDSNASGLLRNRLDGAASDTETLLAHNLADIVGTVAMFLAMLVLMFVYDWRMGASCLLAAVVSVGAMCAMMGGKNAALMAEYQAAQDVMSKAGTEYTRGASRRAFGARGRHLPPHGAAAGRKRRVEHLILFSDKMLPFYQRGIAVTRAACFAPWRKTRPIQNLTRLRRYKKLWEAFYQILV